MSSNRNRYTIMEKFCSIISRTNLWFRDNYAGDDQFLMVLFYDQLGLINEMLLGRHFGQTHRHTLLIMLKVRKTRLSKI